jgi:hypothetical protein
MMEKNPLYPPLQKGDGDQVIRFLETPCVKSGASLVSVEQEIDVDNFTNVTIVKQANIYFNGNVTSRTVLFGDGTRKTLGIILPGEYEFGTADRERMEIQAGTLKALLPGKKDWQTYGPGHAFEIPAHSKFKVAAATVCDYCCSYLKD